MVVGNEGDTRRHSEKFSIKGLGQQAGRAWHMGHQKFHLVDQNAPVAQNKVFPQAGNIGGEQERHVRLLRGTVALAVVAGLAGSYHIHPGIYTVLREGNDVFAGQMLFREMATAVGAHIAVPGKQLVVGEPRAQVERVNFGHTTRANDAIDPNNGLQAGHGIVSAMENCHFTPGLPAHFARRVMGDRLLQRYPGLG